MCKDLGKQLFEPRDSSKNSEVFSLAKTKGVSRFWIGIHDITNEGKFTYDSNGQTIGYKNWNWNEPNDYGSGEDCAEISGWSGTWNDMPCQSLQRFVCENKQPGIFKTFITLLHRIAKFYPIFCFQQMYLVLTFVIQMGKKD